MLCLGVGLGFLTTAAVAAADEVGRA
jgi:hypothetical protein